jgi:hypothetical protein
MRSINAGSKDSVQAFFVPLRFVNVGSDEVASYVEVNVLQSVVRVSLLFFEKERENFLKVEDASGVSLVIIESRVHEVPKISLSVLGALIRSKL